MLCGITLAAFSSQQDTLPISERRAFPSVDVPLLDEPQKWLMGPVVF